MVGRLLQLQKPRRVRNQNPGNMTMTPTDWIGSLGVALLLAAFFLNLLGLLHKHSPVYLLMNLTGAAIACLASVLLEYLPFVILEGCWTLVSAYGLLKLGRATKG